MKRREQRRIETRQHETTLQDICTEFRSELIGSKEKPVVIYEKYNRKWISYCIKANETCQFVIPSSIQFQVRVKHIDKFNIWKYIWNQLKFW